MSALAIVARLAGEVHAGRMSREKFREIAFGETAKEAAIAVRQIDKELARGFAAMVNASGGYAALPDECKHR